MFDPDPNGVVAVTPGPEARTWNEKGWGIFWTVNSFKGGVRRIEKLERICAWAIDMDTGTKDEQQARIERSPLAPSLIVETKRGFQCYWRAKDARPENWNAIVLERLVPFFGADKNARDLARILRMPGYDHCKDPNDRFPCREVHRLEVTYHEAELAQKFAPAEQPLADRAAHDEVRRGPMQVHGDDFWERVWRLDCEEGLARLNGHAAVGGERFTFRRTASGTRNILVDGKGTSCWIDKHGRIGSLAKGGPTLYHWLKWYGNTPRRCVEVLKEIFPQLVDVEGRRAG